MTGSEGTRAIRLDVDLPVSPEEAWRAVATGPGISAWFVPSTVEEREGGATTSSFGPGMGDVEGVVGAWDPPRRVVFRGPQEGEGMVFEWSVEAAAGGTSIVRLVNSGFSSDASWDDEYDAMTEGWRGFLAVLRAYATHFARSPTANVQVAGPVDDPLRAWHHLLGPAGLGLGDRAGTIRSGQAMALAPAAGPPLAGVVEHWTGAPDRPGILVLRLDETPGPGVFWAAVEGRSRSVWLWLYGDARASAGALRDAWGSWMEAGVP